MIAMNPSMDDRRILADMERRLSKDDPELIALMNSRNSQFPNDEAADEGVDDSDKQFDWRWKTITAFLIVALVGLILTAAFAKPSSTDDHHGPPDRGLATISVHTQRRAAGPGATSPTTTPAQRRRRATELSKGEAHAGT